MAENVIEIPDDYEDISFLDELDAIEAQALSLSATKRRRTNTTTSASSAVEVREGAYTAALKGSRSIAWQTQSNADAATVKAEYEQRGGGGAVGGGGGACFKCGMDGHWARDCNGSSSGTVGTGNEVLKECGCGLGSCLVLTANTERNRGRKFYRCPVRQENGGCGFFEWCDESPGDNASVQERARKTGRQQDVCQQPSNRGTTGFTRSWNDYNEGTNTPKSGYGAVPKFETTDNKSYGVKTGSACFKCGEEGHWARDCPTTTSSNATSGVRDKSTGNECYKCGQSGHWAKDCSQSQTAKVRYH